MARFRRLAILLVAALAPLAAQWLHYPTAGVPRNAKGGVNVDAPTPRTADRKPDFSGMWWISADSPCPKDIQGKDGDCIEKGLGLGNEKGSGLAPQTINLGAGIPGGLPYQRWAADLVASRRAKAGIDDPHLNCLPPSYPRAWTLPHINKLIQVPGLIVMLNEFNASYRQVFTDDRPLPEDPQPSWNGYSSGKWEGDTLVIQTVGFRDDIWLDLAGSPLTEAGKVIERIRRPNLGTLEIEVTIDDPKAYTKPWTTKWQHYLVVDTELLDEICLEGERSVQHIKNVVK